MASRTDRLAIACVLAVLLIGVGLVAPAVALGQDGEGADEAEHEHTPGDGHDHGASISINDLDVAQRERARALFSEVMCSCPRENWSRTLGSCPDGCANQQKQTILARVLQGISDREILDEQVRIAKQILPMTGRDPADAERVLAAPPGALGMWVIALPLAGFLGATIVLGAILKSWTGPGGGDAPSQQSDGPAPDDAEIAAIEKELSEVD